MRKIVLILALVGAALAAAGQALPSGSVLFGQNTWLAPDGSVWTGKDGYGYKKLLSPDDLSNYVTTNTNQTITGQKTFSSVTNFNGSATIFNGSTSAQHAFRINDQTYWSQGVPSSGDYAIRRTTDGGPTFDVLTLSRATGNATFAGTVSGVPAVNGNDFVTLNQMNAAVSLDLQDVTANGNSTNRRLNITGAIGALTSSGMSLYSQQAPAGAGTSRTGLVSYLESGNLLSGVELKDSLILTVITTTPHVQGEFKIFNNGSIPTTLFNGEMHAQEFYRTSTRKIKKDIAPFSENATSILNGVDVVEYKLKKGPDYKKIGFIAEDTHEYLSTPEHNVMDQGSSIGLLIKAVQELSAKVEELERRLAECQE